MATNASITGAATTATFDPAAWLSQFESVGGGWFATKSRNLLVCGLGVSDAEINQARRMIGDLCPAEHDALFHYLSDDQPRVSKSHPTAAPVGDCAGATVPRSDDDMTMMNQEQALIIGNSTGIDPATFLSDRDKEFLHQAMADRAADELIEQLSGLDNRYPSVFVQVCDVIGLDVFAIVKHCGECVLHIGSRLDDEPGLFLRCHQLLRAQLKALPGRRQATIDHLIAIGRVAVLPALAV